MKKRRQIPYLTAFLLFFYRCSSTSTSDVYKRQLLDIMLPDGSGLDLLRQMKRRDESIDAIMVTALQGVETALDAMKGEACDYITKPFKIDELRGLSLIHI